jgi:hypothetical protein
MGYRARKMNSMKAIGESAGNMVGAILERELYEAA